MKDQKYREHYVKFIECVIENGDASLIKECITRRSPGNYMWFLTALPDTKEPA